MKADQGGPARPLSSAVSLISTRNIRTSCAPTFSSTSLRISFAPAKKVRGPSCQPSCFSICRTITPTARRPASRARRPRSRTTISRSAAWSMPSPTVLTGMTRLFSSSKTMPRMAPTTWTRTARLRSRSANIRPARPAQPFVDSRFYTTVNMMHTMETLLGLPPMNQNDAYAPVMAPLVRGAGNSAAVYGRLEQSRQRDDLPDQPSQGPGRGGIGQDGLHPSGCGQHRGAQPDSLARSHGSTPMPAPKHTVFPQKGAPEKD